MTRRMLIALFTFSSALKAFRTCKQPQGYIIRLDNGQRFWMPL